MAGRPFKSISFRITNDRGSGLVVRENRNGLWHRSMAPHPPGRPAIHVADYAIGDGVFKIEVHVMPVHQPKKRGKSAQGADRG